MKTRLVLVAVLLLAASTVAGGTVTARRALVAADDRPLGPGAVTVTLGIEHSAFNMKELEVRRGTTVTFVVRNTDPIAHELIVGDAAVHRRHESGTESNHDRVPGELTVAPHATASTPYHFATPGTFVFACHLPGHVAYGMAGAIRVLDS